VNLSGDTCDEVINWVVPTATDNCSVASFTSTHNSGDAFPGGTTVVSYVATDPAGLSAICTFNVTVNDNIPPAISNCPADIVVNLSGGACDEIVNWVAPTATDNCSVASFNSTHNSGDTFPVGTTVVSYVATDPAGLSDLCTFNVKVNDITPPVFNFCPTLVNIATFDVASQTAVVTWQNPTAIDNCGVPIVTSNFSSGDSFPPGLTTVIYTATDGSGNTDTCEIPVDVVGNKAPIALPMIVDVFSGQPIEFCLDVRDEDGDVLIVEDIDDNNLNGVIEGPGSVDNFCFIYTSFDGFEGEELIVFTVCDNGTPIACINVEVRIKVTLDLRVQIYKAFTPDGDNINDVWVIENIQNYPNNQVMIYDRLGGLIFSARDYNNEDIVWDGRSNQNGQNILPTGTYFYKIDLGNEFPLKKGFIELVN
jgi:gliding motility-associated-like protein